MKVVILDEVLERLEAFEEYYFHITQHTHESHDQLDEIRYKIDDLNEAYANVLEWTFEKEAMDLHQELRFEFAEKLQDILNSYVE